MSKKEVNAMDVMEKMKPSLYLNDDELPESAEWDVGEKYKLLVEVKMVSKSESESVDYKTKKKKKVIHAEFEIENIKTVDGSASSKDFEEFEKDHKK